MKVAGTPLLVNQPGTTWSAYRSKDDLWMASATQLDALLAHNELSPVEITESVLNRIASCNGEINAFCHVAADSARDAARQAERRTKLRARLSPLDGLPVHIKDNLFVADIPCTWGSRLFKNHTPSSDDIPVNKLRAAGAVLIGKTNTPEFALMGKTENDVFGSTRNPWNLSVTPGGSSGGAAAAVAAGMGPLALATDAGGSIRRPASYCGVVGLKTSLGVVTRGVGFPATVNDFQTIGPIARDIADAVLLFDVIADRNTMLARQPSTARIAILPDASLGPVEPEVLQCLHTVADHLIQLRHQVHTAPAPWDLAQVESLWQFFSSVGLAHIATTVDSALWKNQASAFAQALALKGAEYNAAEYAGRLDELRALRIRAQFEWFKHTDFILTPTSPSAAWKIDEPYVAAIDGHEVGPRACSRFMTVVNAAGLPALNLPVGLTSTGLPIGVQIIGPPSSDAALLRLGLQLEALLAKA